MTSKDNFLCCCEYLDVNDERNHILACCCNCQDFDEGVESVISGRGFPHHNKRNLMATIQDRLRVPWKGGAKRITPEVAISTITVPVALIIASNGVIWTMVGGAMLITFPLCVRVIAPSLATRFYNTYFVTSFVVLYLVFEFVVIPFLEILVEENIGLTVATLLAAWFFWKTKNAVGAESSRYTCQHCQTLVPFNSSHRAWLGCCVGPHNARYYTLGLTATTIALLYGSNLALTTVCHPFLWFATIMLPDDCSYVYDLFETALSFVSGLYSGALAVFFAILLIHQAITSLMCELCARTTSYKKITPDTLTA